MEWTISDAGVQPVTLGDGQDLPPDCDGLLLVSEMSEAACEPTPPALTQALARDIPVLGIGWGMHALNVALGGKPPTPVAGHLPVADGAPVKTQVFLSPGGKVASTIGGSGWVSVPCAHDSGIREAQKAARLMASAYALDGVIEAVEVPGRHWVIGVQWPAHRPAALPRGFDSVLLAFMERSAGS